MYSITDITRAYLEPHRKYHTLDHLVYMFNMAGRHGIKLNDQQIVAIWYHDYVYDPKSQSNEEDSAYAASKRLMAGGYTIEAIFNINRMIVDTKDHLPTHELSKMVIDLDLCGLGETPEVYIETGLKIREEYSHLTDDQWVEGRLKFINKFLNRPSIFQTDWGRANFEAQALQNLKIELIRLGCGGFTG